ncbi:ERAP1-like C-terminal domain-containing protein [Jimgerdemannia flammicorona]|nr:ERAP1-like C-terminal domain-containing protein [Jimgerdemannia flammicorona]
MPGEDDQTTLLRGLAITNAGIGSDPETVTEAKRRFWKLVRDDDAEVLHPNLRRAVYGIALRNSDGDGSEEYDAILKLYEDPTLSPEQKMTALHGLGLVQTPELFRRTIELSLDDKRVRRQDTGYIYAA